MSRYIETAEDAAAYWIGGAIFTVVAAATAAVMAVGFGAFEVVDRLRNRS